MDRALFVGTDGRDVLAFVCRPGGGFAVLRNGEPVGAWAAADQAAGRAAFGAMIDAAAAPARLPAAAHVNGQDGPARRAMLETGATQFRWNTRAQQVESSGAVLKSTPEQMSRPGTAVFLRVGSGGWKLYC